MRHAMCMRGHRIVVVAAALSLGFVSAASAQQATEPAPVKIGIITFLTGPAAAPFGIPGRNGAEVIIEALNAGKVPAPYNQIGLGGAKIEAKYVDEAGSTANVVTEYRNLVQRDKVDVVVGFVSSGSCLAVAPVADELQALTVFDVCGTTRIFEEKPRKYIFRVNPHATMDNVAAARYVLSKLKTVNTYSGINQNYAWGQDSWRDFTLAMKNLAPQATADKVLFPKLFAGEFGAEISALLTSNAQVIHSSFYDGDLEAFIYQGGARGLLSRTPIVFTTGETSIYRVGAKLPDGVMIGARGPHALMAHPGPLNSWLWQAYTDRFSMPPVYPAYHMAQSLFGLKTAWEKAQAKKGGARPTTDEVIAAFEGIEVVTPSTTVRLAIGKGHQGVSDTAYGTYRFNKSEGKPELVDVTRYPAECVNPPADMDSVTWLESGMKGAKCD
jgi:branched-chain amino acid transport system substrate-binding protein